MSEKYTYKELTELLRSSRFLIYGAGFQAQRFYECLKKMNCTDNVIAFAVTKKNDGEEMLFDKKIIEICNADKNDMIIIAAHNKSAYQMENELINLGNRKYLILYPYLSQLEFGMPIQIKAKINVCDFIRKSTELYYMPIVYMAIENYFHENDNGDKIYIKMQSEYSDISSAVLRLNALHDKIQIYSEELAHNDYNVKISKDNIIIDGNHRIALAKYFNIEYIYADIYDITEKEYVEVHKNAVFSRNKIKAMFTNEEYIQILDTDKKLRSE